MNFSVLIWLLLSMQALCMAKLDNPRNSSISSSSRNPTMKNGVSTKRKQRTTDEKIETSLTSGRNRRDELTLDDLFKSIDHSVDNQTFSETINMPHNEAQDHCSKTLKQSKYFDKCKDILKDEYEGIEHNCIDDLQNSGSADMAEMYLNVYEETCMTDLGREVKIIDGKPSPESRDVLKLLGDINATFTERRANAPTPWVEKDTSSFVQLRPSHIIFLLCGIMTVNAITLNSLF